MYLTATLSDDAILITHFDADPQSVRVPITPAAASDLGDRLILVPEELYPDLAEEDFRAFVAAQAETRNVVVIVPSWRRAEVWAPLAAAVRGADELDETLTALRAGHVGLVVLVNKYDGIDLPGDACRVLVLDGLPEARGLLERWESAALDASDLTLTRQMQRIEQGMGRGVRANEDYCVVLLFGSRLTARVHSSTAKAKLSPGSAAQLALSGRVAEQLHGRPFSEFADVVEQCLGRDQSWIAASRDVLDGHTYPTESEVSAVALGQRAAFSLASRGQFAEAADRMQGAIAAAADRQECGLLKQQAAAYRHFADPVEAQKLQRSAVQDNRMVLKPITGVPYRVLKHAEAQGQTAARWLADHYARPSDLVLGVKDLLERLTPDPDDRAVARFEQAIEDLGHHLGLQAQRPEKEIGNGPDDLWALGELRFLVIECKSGATTTEISRSDVEQLGQSLDWFASAYDSSCRAAGVLIHPFHQLHQQATARDGMRIMTFERLAALRAAVLSFAQAVADGGKYTDAQAVTERLTALELAAAAFPAHWTRAPRPAHR